MMKTFNWKYVSLLILVIQNSMLILTMRYTRASVSEDRLYLASTAVLMSEVIKTVLSFIVIYSLLPTPTLSKFFRFIYREMFVQWKESMKLALPAILYLIQNNLQYIAATNLDAATFQVTYQLKILTTAFFTVIILKRRLLNTQWIALSILTMGIAMVVFPKKSMDVASVGNQLNVTGVICVLMACILSGMAGVSFEKIIKAVPDKKEDIGLYDPNQSSSLQLWVRNMQLSMFSVILATVMIWIQDKEVILNKGFFQNYSSLTWIVILIQALGGLIVAFVVKYADNILKGFATSISIILSSVISYFLFEFEVTLIFSMGACLVIYATYLYTL